MDIIQNPHDKFFKETFGNIDVVQDFLNSYLPKNILDIIDIETVTPLKDSFVNHELDESFSDLLVSVNIAEKKGYLYFLFEHKSYQTKNIVLQLLKYMFEIWNRELNKEKVNELPLIIPLVIYHGSQKWKVPKTLGELMVGYNKLPANVQKYIPNYEYMLYDLSTFHNEDIKGDIRVKVSLSTLKHIQINNIEQLLLLIQKNTMQLLECDDETITIEYLETYIRYILSTRDDVSIEMISERLSDEGRERLMTVAEQLIKKGREEGLKEGLKEGSIKTKFEVAKRMLQSGVDEEQIRTFTNLTKKELEQIKKE